MPSRALTVLSAAAVATAALVAGAPSAFAEEICNTTTGGPFAGSVVCVQTDPVNVDGTRKEPYTIGGVCIGSGPCQVPPTSGELDVPNVVWTSAPLYGQVCHPWTHGTTECRPLDVENLEIWP